MTMKAETNVPPLSLRVLLMTAVFVPASTSLPEPPDLNDLVSKKNKNGTEIPCVLYLMVI